MRLSLNFGLAEFACHSGDDVPSDLLPNVQALVTDVLQPIRSSWNGLVTVMSGYRSLAWNTRVGGAKNSTHMTAKGADIRPSKIESVPFLHQMILDMYRRGELPELGGLGLYRGWVHVDTERAADGHLRQWKGTGVGSEQ